MADCGHPDLTAFARLDGLGLEVLDRLLRFSGGLLDVRPEEGFDLLESGGNRSLCGLASLGAEAHEAHLLEVGGDGAYLEKMGFEVGGDGAFRKFAAGNSEMVQ